MIRMKMTQKIFLLSIGQITIKSATLYLTNIQNIIIYYYIIFCILPESINKEICTLHSFVKRKPF